MTDTAKKPAETVEEYINSFPTEVKTRLSKLRKFIKDLLPKEVTESISYGVPTFKLNGKPVVYFAAFKKHIGIYPFPSEAEEFKHLSESYHTSKGAIQFPHTKEIPYDIVEQIVKFRLDEVS